MYFLWRTKPQAILGIDGKWLPTDTLDTNMDKVMAFTTTDGARVVQKRDFPKENTTVINKKTFQQRLKLKKMPVFHTVNVQAQAEPEDGGKKLQYMDYLEQLTAVMPGAGKVIIPPSNIRETFETPLISKIRDLLANLQQSLSSLSDEETHLQEEIKYLNMVISDRLHQVEMYQMSDEECVFYVTDLKKTEIERRRRKNELTTVQIARDALQNVDAPVIKDALKEIEKLGRQEYRCRALTDQDPLVSKRQ